LRRSSPAEPSAPSGSAASGDAAQQDARRFARLLVEEICLYHGERVEQGRRHQDLTQRLEEEIERAQAMYEQRVSPAVRSQGDFFHEALVQVLAGGNAGALGTGVRQPG
ncbi:MAG: hypothetical protein JSV80_10000, partial [Acidobacteriota bacterium]